MGRGGGEGRVPSFMTAAAEREVSNSYFYSFFLMCCPWGIRLEQERNKASINPELELELIQTQMTQKPMLLAEGECACVAQMARAKIRGRG